MKRVNKNTCHSTTTPLVSPETEPQKSGMKSYLVQNNRVLSMAVVCDRLGLSRVTLWRMIRAKQFPEAIKISPNRVGWPEKEVSCWISQRIAERDSTAASRSAKGQS